jgi:hypothetical protein
MQSGRLHLTRNLDVDGENGTIICLHALVLLESSKRPDLAKCQKSTFPSHRECTTVVGIHDVIRRPRFSNLRSLNTPIYPRFS